MYIQKNVLESIINASKYIASKDEIRVTLLSVQVTVTDKEYTVEASDGHKLTRCVFAKTEPASHPDPGVYYFDKSQVKYCTLALKEAPKYNDSVDVGEHFTIKAAMSHAFPSLDVFDGAFKQDKKDGISSISFNAEYLLEMLYALREHKRNETVTLYFDNTQKTAAILVESSGNKGLLMPVRK